MEVQDAIWGLKDGKAPGTNGIPNRALKHLPLSDVYLLVVLYNVFFSIPVLPSSLETHVFDPETLGRMLHCPSLIDP